MGGSRSLLIGRGTTIPSNCFRRVSLAIKSSRNLEIISRCMSSSRRMSAAESLGLPGRYCPPVRPAAVPVLPVLEAVLERPLPVPEARRDLISRRSSLISLMSAVFSYRSVQVTTMHHCPYIAANESRKN